MIGLRGKDGVVLAVEKLITSKLYEPDCGTRIFTIDTSIGMVSKRERGKGGTEVLMLICNVSWLVSNCRPSVE